MFKNKFYKLIRKKWFDQILLFDKIFVNRSKNYK